MKHPRHTYGGFIPAISERGMTLPQMSTSVWRPRPRDACGEYDRSLASLDDHPHTPKVRVLMKQPWDTDEKRGPLYPSAWSMVRRVLGKYPAFQPSLWDSEGTTFLRGGTRTCFLIISFTLAI
jgi:hypothetical protein